MNNFVKTDLVGKINNLPNFKNEALLPIFEAVVNSIQGVHEGGEGKRGNVLVRVVRENATRLEDLESEISVPIIGFEISDDGIGFNDKNFESFLTAETTHKIEKGCKGVGRFVWLKSFGAVDIESIYTGESSVMMRKIRFNLTEGIKEVENVPTNAERGTVVKLLHFKEEYRILPSAYKTTSKIAQRILEHCLYYFIAGTAPKIIVIDGESSIDLDEIFTEIKDNIETEMIKIGPHDFCITHIKLYATHAQMHKLVLCAGDRDVKSIKIGPQLGTNAEFDNDGARFVYSAYVTSGYLNQHVDTIRLDFDIPDEGSLLGVDPDFISMNQIKAELIAAARGNLAPFIESVKLQKMEMVSDYVANINPLLRAIPTYCPEVYEEIEPGVSNDKLNEIFFKYKGKAEWEIRKQSEKLLKTSALDIPKIQVECDQLAHRLADFQKDQLATYIMFRKMVIDLLEKKLEFNKVGTHYNEDIVHDIVFPRKSTTDDLDYQQHNMWLIDERLTFHTFAASDKRLSETTSSESDDRPDIVAFAEIDEDRTARAVSLVEFKKPSRKSYDETPGEQLLRYARAIRGKDIEMPNGRTLHVSDSTRFYCYAISDLSKKVREFAENNNYAQLKNEFGYYTYVRALNAHIEIIAFDKIVIDARQRHKAFFEKLGI